MAKVKKRRTGTTIPREWWRDYPEVRKVIVDQYNLPTLNPRPPKKWFYAMMKRVRGEYPEASKKELQQIVGGIWWHQYRPSIRKKLLKRYDRVGGMAMASNPRRAMVVAEPQSSGGTGNSILVLAVIAGLAVGGWYLYGYLKKRQWLHLPAPTPPPAAG
jgi:hypothetical protein